MGDVGDAIGTSMKSLLDAYIATLTDVQKRNMSDSQRLETYKALGNAFQPFLYQFSDSILNIDGSSVSSYTVDSSGYEFYKTYYVDIQENQKFPFMLSSSPGSGRKISVVYDSTNYGTLPISPSSGSIRCQNGATFSTICLFTSGERVDLEYDGTYWNVTNDWFWGIRTGMVSTSDWTNRLLGTIELLMTSGAGYELWEIIIEETSGFRGIIAGINVDSLYLWRIDDGSGGVGGFFTSGRNITGQTSSTVSSLTSNTKNMDSYFYTGFGMSGLFIRKDLFWSDDGSQYGSANSSQSMVAFNMDGDVRGCNLLNYDSNNFMYRTATNGAYVISNAGGRFHLSTQDDFYNGIAGGSK